ncbi:unnamed protein product [Spirodela intermedia]|uniref:Plastid lipid-associated protein/fibrillin conserved domain-containing protein n=1 Tax=Spirodela intermedia TaxID=51605 RepID=A0A7I8JIP0_SPIIN|nr:unnamed protein product [Spirodela intermedia]CAA6669635.1 unnamed protein product [Spirodela intermedia]
MALLSCRISVIAGKPSPGFRLRSPARSGESSVGFSSESGRRNPRLSSFPAPSAAQWDERRGETPGEGRGKKQKPPKRKPEEDKRKGLGDLVAGVGGLVEVPENLDDVIEKVEVSTSEIIDELRELAEEAVTEASGIPDEWGERAEPEAEPPAEPDLPRDDDEWGRDPGNGASPALPDEDYGLKASSEVRGEVLDLVNQLEIKNPTPAPMEALKLLDGNWILLYTAFSELLPLIAIGSVPLLKVKRISQEIDTQSLTIKNSTTISSPFASFSFSASASFEVQTPSRIQVQFREGSFDPPEISQTVDLPESTEVFGRSVDLLPLRQTLGPLQEAAAAVARAVSEDQSWLLTTFLDEDLRISRGDGGLFVLVREGSPLLDLL